MDPHKKQIWLVRHGETEWAAIGRHTGWRDIPLTPRGEDQARNLGKLLNGRAFSLVMVSPLQRARQTCELAGYAHSAVINPDMREWNYGDYEGLTSTEIRERLPDWNIWRNGVEGGETVNEVGVRARRVLELAMAAEGDVLLFAHGHLLRILTACWLDLPPVEARRFALWPSAVGVLGYEHDVPVIRSWNWEPAPRWLA